MSVRCWSAMAVAGFLLGGCGPDYTLALETQAHGADVEDDHVTIEVGKAIGVAALEDGDRLEPDVSIELWSSDPEVMDISATGAPSEFVLWGIHPGGADIEVLVEGEQQDAIAVEVLPRQE